MSIFVTADHHFDHKNIIKYTERPFGSLSHMHDELIRLWNEKVEPQDTVYVLGDFCFGKPIYLDKLNGHLHLVKGNHDSKATVKHKRWVSVSDYKELKYEDVLFVMMHYPLESWRRSKHGSMHLHGHCHGNNFGTMINRWDVGVDIFDYAPENIDWFLERRKERGPYQHH